MSKLKPLSEAPNDRPFVLVRVDGSSQTVIWHEFPDYQDKDCKVINGVRFPIKKQAFLYYDPKKNLVYLAKRIIKLSENAFKGWHEL